VGNPHRNAGPRRNPEDIAGKEVHVAVDDIVGAFSHDSPQTAAIGPHLGTNRARHDLATELFRLRRIFSQPSLCRHDVNGDPVSIQLPQDMHEPGLDSAITHRADNVKYLYRARKSPLCAETVHPQNVRQKFGT